MEHLHPQQKEVLLECKKKGSGAMALVMGYGKTLLSLVLSQELVGYVDGQIIIVASKSLIANWVNELHKFFDKSITYIIFHKKIKSRFIKIQNCLHNTRDYFFLL